MDFYHVNQNQPTQNNHQNRNPQEGRTAGNRSSNELEFYTEVIPSDNVDAAKMNFLGQMNSRPPMSSIISKKQFMYVQGTVTGISNFSANGCTKLFQVMDEQGNITNLVIQPDTYFVDNIRFGVGMPIIGFYDGNAPVPLIYPPQFQAVVVAMNNQWENITVDYFNRSLVNSDNTLKLNISDSTDIVLENGQMYDGNLANRNLIVIYGNTTRSIPAQTTPKKVIVMCEPS